MSFDKTDLIRIIIQLQAENDQLRLDIDGLFRRIHLLEKKEVTLTQLKVSL